MLLQKRPKAEREKRVRELLSQVGLSDKAGRRPAELSGGQQQRIAVARALAPKPQFILADEPTANLDSVSAGNLLDIMARLNKEEQMTFIFSTHDQRVIDRARRIITLEDGKIVADEKRDN
jgi:putative ABC transport system ATP-binding protein